MIPETRTGLRYALPGAANSLSRRTARAISASGEKPACLAANLRAASEYSGDPKSSAICSAVTPTTDHFDRQLKHRRVPPNCRYLVDLAFSSRFR